MSIFTREGDELVPSGHARGPWDPQALHGGAPAALAVRAAERLAPGMRMARLTFEFLGGVPLLPLSVEARLAKPGRRFQVVDATVSAAGRDVAWARLNFVRAEHVEGLPQTAAGPPLTPGPEGLPRNLYADHGRDEFGLTAMEIRFAESEFNENGPAKAWFRFDRPLVEGEEPTPAQLAVAAGDFGNGISRVVSWDDWLFVNTELTVHLHRDPEGEWVGLDARTIIEPNGSGLAVSTLYDLRGPVGTAAQALFVARRSE
jgi:hypothetical protein